MAAYPQWDSFEAQEIIERLQHLQGPALPILHALQNHFGYVDREVIPVIADRLNLSCADIHGILSFYHEFRDHPPGPRVVKLCRAEACQAVGSEDLVEYLKNEYALAIDASRQKGSDQHRSHGTASRDGVTIESVYCLGNCALGPSAMVDGVVEGRLTSARLAKACGLEKEQ